MKEVVFCFIETNCWSGGVDNVAEQNGFVPLNSGHFFRDFLRNKGFGDTEGFLELKQYIDNGIVVPIDLVLKVCMIGIQAHLQESLFFVNFTKYKELMQVLEKEGYKLKCICYIYHETLEILLENYRQKSQFYAEMVEEIEKRILKKRDNWKEIISDIEVVRIGYDLRKFDEFQENIKQLLV